jgi:PPP family 3-phenylpropionic acid transporter
MTVRPREAAQKVGAEMVMPVLYGHWRGAAALPLAVTISLFYAALFLAYGVIVPYFPVWLHAKGLSPVEISTITAAPLLVRVLFTPSMGLLADRLGNYRLIIVTLAWSALGLALLVSSLAGYWPILAVGVSFLLAIGTMLPLIETVAVAGVRTAGLDYGRMRLWGSITFIVANFAGGVLIEALGGGFGIWLVASAAALIVGAAHLLPAPERRPAVASPAPAHWRVSFPVRLLRSRLFVVFLVAIGCVHGAHATFYTFGALHWQAQGLSAAWVGTLWAIGVTAEVILFAFSASVVRRFNPAQLIVAGAGAAVLRWSVMAFNPPLAVLVPLQTLHALTYGAAHLGAILFITRAVPQPGMGSAQSFYAVVAAGLVLGLVGLASGALYESLGGAVFFLPAVVSAIGLGAGLLLLRRWDGGLLWPEALPAPASVPIAKLVRVGGKPS